MTELKPFLVRLRPDVRTLLEQTAQQRNKPIAVIINDELRSSLSKHGDLSQRLNKMLA
jgi:deoxyxylulose-5-phosphate synthase